MYIREVKVRTNLTKKAIRYYIEKGLINPSINEAGYRIYGDNDVEILQLIGFLRNINMSIADIKTYIASNDEVKKEMLMVHSSKIERQIKELSKIKDLIDTVNQSDDVDYSVLSEDLIKHESSNGLFTINRLAHLFPSSFERYIVIHFTPYLNVPIDTEEKRRAFKDIVEFIDDTQIELSEETKRYLDILNQDTDLDGEKLDSVYRNMSDRMKELASIDTTDEKSLNEYRKTITDYMKRYDDLSEDNELREIKEINTELKRALKDSGYYEVFIKNLKIINPEYREYHKKINLLNQSIGLSYDGEGNIIFNSKIKE